MSKKLGIKESVNHNSNHQIFSVAPERRHQDLKKMDNHPH
jgi:hypothetical protein